mmetsp:Transcript_3353/g.7784  ORF Transcript_3353/g.7784 Transcript_3353/m.7784 type:complete len:209 (-) Transcript_3353:198-824(-)
MHEHEIQQDAALLQRGTLDHGGLLLEAVRHRGCLRSIRLRSCLDRVHHLRISDHGPLVLRAQSPEAQHRPADDGCGVVAHGCEAPLTQVLSNQRLQRIGAVKPIRCEQCLANLTSEGLHLNVTGKLHCRDEVLLLCFVSLRVMQSCRRALGIEVHVHADVPEGCLHRFVHLLWRHLAQSNVEDLCCCRRVDVRVAKEPPERAHTTVLA